MEDLVLFTVSSEVHSSNSYFDTDVTKRESNRDLEYAGLYENGLWTIDHNNPRWHLLTAHVKKK